MQQITVVGKSPTVPFPIMERSDAPLVGTNLLDTVTAQLALLGSDATLAPTNLPFIFIPIKEQLETFRGLVEPPLDSTVEEERIKGDIAMETAEKSPLLALAGTVECDLSAIEPAPVAELRVVPQDPELAKHATTPLLALAGTLECNVPDFGKRHDEYIGDALIAELRGEHDD